jgi:Restriction endonuclease
LGGHLVCRVRSSARVPALSTSPFSAAIFGRFMPIQSCRQQAAASAEIRSLLRRRDLAGSDLQAGAREVLARLGFDLAPRVNVETVPMTDELMRYLAARPNEVHRLTSRKFEQLIARVFDKKGYGVELTQATRDDGFDILARRSDGLTNSVFLIECKRFAPHNHVGVGIVRSLYGVVQQRRATAGIVVTTSFFTKDAQRFQQSVANQLELNDYFAVSRWLALEA